MQARKQLNLATQKVVRAQIEQVVPFVFHRIGGVFPVAAEAHPFQRQLAAVERRGRIGEARVANGARRGLHFLAAVVGGAGDDPLLVRVLAVGPAGIEAPLRCRCQAAANLDAAVQS